MDEKRNYAVDLKEIVYLALNKWVVFAIIVISCIIAALVYSYVFVTPLYDSTGKIYIMNKNTQTINTSDLSVSSYLTRDYENLITDRAVLDEVARELNDEYTYSELKSAVSIKNPDNTRFIEITVRTTSAVDSKKIVDTVCRVSQQKIIDLLGIDRVTIVREGNIAQGPSVPNTVNNVKAGVFLAIVAYVLALVALYLFNDKINSTDDVNKYLDLTVLGNLPYNQAKARSK